MGSIVTICCVYEPNSVYLACSTSTDYHSSHLGLCTYFVASFSKFFWIKFYRYLELNCSRIARFLAISSSQRFWSDLFIELSTFLYAIGLRVFIFVLWILLLIIEFDLFCNNCFLFEFWFLLSIRPFDDTSLWAN